MVATSTTTARTISNPTTNTNSTSSSTKAAPSAAIGEGGDHKYYEGLLVMSVSGNRITDKGLTPLGKVLRTNMWLIGGSSKMG